MNRTTFKAAHSAIRKEARERAIRHAASVRDGVSQMVWRSAGALIGIRVTRTATMGGRRVQTEPAGVFYPTICDRAPRQRILEQLAWARHYRGEACHNRHNPRLRAIAITAARLCIADARALQTAFARLP